MNIWQEGFARTSLYRRHNNRIEATAKRRRASPVALRGRQDNCRCRSPQPSNQRKERRGASGWSSTMQQPMRSGCYSMIVLKSLQCRIWTP